MIHDSDKSKNNSESAYNEGYKRTLFVGDLENANRCNTTGICVADVGGPGCEDKADKSDNRQTHIGKHEGQVVAVGGNSENAADGKNEDGCGEDAEEARPCSILAALCIAGIVTCKNCTDSEAGNSKSKTGDKGNRLRGYIASYISCAASG